MLTYQVDPQVQTSVKFQSKLINFSFNKLHLKISANCLPFCSYLNMLTHRPQKMLDVCNLLPHFRDWYFEHCQCEVVLKCMAQNLTEDNSTLVQVMAWCHQTTSHYLSQCWPRCMSSYVSLDHNELMVLPEQQAASVREMAPRMPSMASLFHIPNNFAY